MIAKPRAAIKNPSSLSRKSRYTESGKMHLATTSPARKPAPNVGMGSAKNRVWDFFEDGVKRAWKIDPQVVEAHLEKTTARTTTALGVPHWPSRDPIGEEGGLNLYAMVRNNAVNLWDYLGLDPPGKGLNDPAACCGTPKKKYDPLLHCCIDNKLVSNFDEVEIKVCIRIADVMFGDVGASAGFYHMWIDSPYGSFGLGEADGDIPGANSDRPDSPTDETSVVDHTGESDKDGSRCTTEKVNRCCIAEKAKELGLTGKSCAKENCNKWAYRQVEECLGDVKALKKAIKELHKDRLWDENPGYRRSLSRYYDEANY